MANQLVTDPWDPGRINLFHGDALTVAPLLVQGFATLLLTSTPYPGQRGFEDSLGGWLGWWPARFHILVKTLDPVRGVLIQDIIYKRTEDGWYNDRIFSLPQIIEGLGLHCQDVYIWDKLNAPPSGNHDRHDRQEYEFCFVYTMSENYTFNPQRAPYSPKTIGKAKTGNMRKPDVVGSHAGGHADLHPEGARQGNVLRMSASGDQNRPRVKGGVFPRALADRFILTYTNPGDWVLDPFMGSGTTVVQALKHNRRAVGIDIDKEACDVARVWVEKTLKEGIQDKLPLED